MCNITKGLFLLLAGVSIASPAMAGTKVGDFDIGSNMSMTTNYVWRGVSQSDKHAAVQGGITVNHATGLYAGAWASSVDFDDNSEASMELDLFGGFAYEFSSGLKLDVGVIHYDYPGAAGRLQYDFNEVYLGGSYKINGLGMSAKYSYSNDFFGPSLSVSSNNKSAYYVEGALTYDLPQEFVVAAHYGYTAGKNFDNPATVGNPNSYNDYSFGVSKEILGFSVDLSFYGTDRDGRILSGDNASDRVVLKFTKNF
ncbi:MAG: hypothetical protein HQL94_02525 [Magnetococcales bacterium]|nr:hypothetical protein [Magnetococcales bacterium]MBF0438012.1 hypothetical protein [Magnetococcales bacterium]